MEPFLRFCGIRKAFGPKEVLCGVDLEVRRGETLVILGGSGTGKSVLLKITVGLLAPDAGTLFLEGQDVTAFDEARWLEARKQVSYLFQQGALFDSMSVFDNVAFPLREHRACAEEEVAARVGEKLALVGLESSAELFPADLSGGMRKRVALARAIVLEPRCILYDEPTAGLDPVTADSIDHLIRRMQRRLGVTSVVVTHDIRSMFHIGDRVAFLSGGRIAFLGTPEEARAAADPGLSAFIQGRSPDEPEC